MTIALVPGTTGCTTPARERPAGSRPLLALLTNSSHASQIAKPTVESLAAAFSKGGRKVVPRKPTNALVLSGGGQYASYNAGILVGWSDTGTRPEFDVVTGMSSGALVAVYAYLGCKYDAVLKHHFTTVADKDIFTLKPVRQFIRSRSLADPTNLQELLASQVNDEMMDDLRQAHLSGRRLYVGTMNVYTRRLTVWDIGAIACSEHAESRDLILKVLLAASAIPGLMPSVHFDVQVNGVHYEEEHIDGGAVSQAFLRLAPGMEQGTDKINWLKGSNLYVMAAGKLYADPISPNPGLLKRVSSTVSAALYALFRAELMGMYAFCVTSGMKFHTIAIPQDASAPANSMTFQPVEMKKLFQMGYTEGCRGARWRLTPPGTEPGEEEAPRDVSPLFPPCQQCDVLPVVPLPGSAFPIIPASVSAPSAAPTTATQTEPPSGSAPVPPGIIK